MGSNSCWDPCIFKNLYELELRRFSNMSSEFSNYEFSKLEKLKLIGFSTKERTEFHLPALRSLDFMTCSNIFFKEMSKLEKIEIFELSSESTREVIRRAPSLKEMRVSEVVLDLSFHWFLNYFGNRLEFLEILHIADLVNFTGTSKNIKLNKCKYLRSISIQRCSDLQENFFWNEIKSLRRLEIENLDELHYSGEKKWKILWNLEDFLLGNCRNLDDRVFQENKISNLNMLNLVEMPMLTGRYWEDMPNLDSVYFFGVTSMEDSFFSGMKQKSCENLSSVDFYGYCEVGGSNWGGKEFTNLGRISFRECCYLCDFLFSENSFPMLQNLRINDCNESFWNRSLELNGIGWKKMRNLSTLIIMDCKYFGDVFFTEQESPLNYLTLKRCPSLKGENWKFMVGLTKFTHFGIPLCVEKLMKNKPFPETCCIIEEEKET